MYRLNSPFTLLPAPTNTLGADLEASPEVLHLFAADQADGFAFSQSPTSFDQHGYLYANSIVSGFPVHAPLGKKERNKLAAHTFDKPAIFPVRFISAGLQPFGAEQLTAK